MAIINWPRSWWGSTEVTFGLMPKSIRSKSPWTMRQSVYGPHVQYWSASIKFPPMKDADLAAREALIEELAGGVNLLRIGHPFRKRPMFNDDVDAGVVGFSDGTYFDDGSGWANGYLPSLIHVAAAAAQGDTSVVVGGLPASTSRCLRRGDLVEFRINGIADETPRLHRVLRDSDSDASGETRIAIAPPLRGGLAVGDTVNIDYPTSVFRLNEDGTGMATRNAAWIGNMEIGLTEALI